MAHNQNPPRGSGASQSFQGQGQRRARSASQPTAPGHLVSGSSRAVEPLDFSFLDQFNPGLNSAPVSGFPQTEYDEDAFARALRSLQDMPPPANIPPIPPPVVVPPGQSLPNPTEAFLAALPWLQYMQLQSQYSQQQQQQQAHQIPQQFQFMGPPTVPQQPIPGPSTGGRLRTFSETSENQSQTIGDTPSPEGREPSETEQVVSAEDKRRRNTAASARFRIKKKQWTLNLERTISDLSGRVEELEREAAELRRENGWLKEIVMLKSKRLAGTVPDLEQGTSTSNNPPDGASRSPDGGKDSNRSGSSEGRGAREEKGKGREAS